ncbi:MAG: nuclear fragile X mental retardation-interacting protein 1 [Pirellulales bacterium]|nr:nuclear fragile X mental retardation-interacting protein 1 [Pirellulales bacterium]
MDYCSDLWKLAWAACLAVVCLLVVGCGRSVDLASQEEIERIKAERRKNAAEEGMAYKDSIAEKRKAQAEAKAEIERKRQLILSQKKKNVFPKQNKRIKRPRDFKDWKKRDYYLAKAEADPRLVEAVEYLGNQFAGDEHAAVLLAELLLPGLPRGMEDVKVKALRGSRNTLTETLVGALLKNRTESALNTLKTVILHPQPGDGVAVAQKVLQCLARNPCKQTEPIILEALLHPTEPVDKGTGHPNSRRQIRNAKDTQQLVRVAQAAMASGVSEEFREELAKRITEPGLPLEYRRVYSDLLMEPWPQNISAQMVLFEDSNATKKQQARLQKQWAEYSSGALARLHGLEPAFQGRHPNTDVSQSNYSRAGGTRPDQAGKAAAADAKFLERVVMKLWSKSVTAAADDRLYRATSLDEAANTILLSATMPRDSVRKSLYDVLTRNWQDGPKALAEVGLFDGIICEPGFWPVLKSAHFASDKLADNKRSTSKNPRLVKNEPIRRQAQPDPWQARIVELLLANCTHMEKAANAHRKLANRKDSGVSKKLSANDFPVKLHDNPRLVAEYRLEWPSGIKNTKSELLPDGTKLWYAKFSQTAVFEVVVSQYYGGLKSSHRHLGPKGCWLESLNPVDGTGKIRSIDVVIQRTPSTVQVSTGAGERLLIDILAVEIENPSKSTR